MSLSLFTAATAFRVLVGVIGVGYSIYSNRTDTGQFDFSKVSDAIFGETVGGLFSDWLREGTTAAHDALIQRLEASAADPILNELQLTIRRAQILATLVAVQACISRFELDRQTITAKLKTVLRNDAELLWLNAVVKDLRQQLNESPSNISKDELTDLVSFISDIEKSTNVDMGKELKERAIVSVLSDIRNRYYSQLGGQLDVPFNDGAYKAVEDAIRNGWTLTEIPTGAITELGIGGLAADEADVRHDWFSLVCTFYNADFKTNQRIQTALIRSKVDNVQNAVLKATSEGLNKLQNIGEAVGSLTSTVSEFRAETRDQLNKTYSAVTAMGGLLTQALENYSKQAGASPVELAALSSALISEFTAPSMEGMVIRSELAQQLADGLTANNVLMLYGSTGMGKSILSYQVAEQSGLKWRRIDMRGHDANAIRQRLLLAGAAVQASLQPINLVIDDLNFDKEVTQYDRVLADLINATNKRGAKIIISSQNPLPSIVSTSCGINGDSVLSVPALNTDEVKELAILHHCADVDRWTNLIWAQTKGHPLLAHVRILNMEQNGWKVADATELFQPESIQQAREKVRNILTDTLQEGERTLVYRLSIFTTPFTREQAVQMASYKPTVSLGGEVFDRLVGPWIEPVDRTHYRLSPLVEGNAQMVFGEDETKRLHRKASRTYLALKSLTQVEFGALLMHGVLGDDIQPFISCTMGWLKLSAPEQALIANHVEWFKFLALDKPLLSNGFGNQFARTLQFEIAEALKDEDAGKKIALRWDIELKELGSKLPDEAQDFMLSTFECRFLQIVLFSSEIDFDFHLICAWTVRMLSALQRLKESFGRVVTGEEPPPILDTFHKPVFVLGNVIARCHSAEDVMQFVRALDTPDDESAKRLRELLREEENSVVLLVDKVWLEEVNAETPDWVACLDRIAELMATARKWQADALLANLYVAKAILYQEYLDGHETALATLEEGIVELGYEHLEIMNYRAKISLLEKDYENALRIWNDFLPRLVESKHYGRLFFCHDAQVAAANLERWEDVLKFARLGIEMALHTPWDMPEMAPVDPVFSYCFRADSAVALWLLRRKSEALDEIAAIVTWLQGFQVETVRGAHRVLYFRLRYLITWLHLGTPPSVATPSAGFFTNPNNVEASVTDLATAPYTFFWYLLAEIEMGLGDGEKYWSRLTEELDKAPDKVHKFAAACLGIKRQIREEQYQSLPVNYANVLDEFGEPSETQEVRVAAMRNLLFASVLMHLSKQRGTTDLPLDAWLADLPTLGFSQVVEWLRFVSDAVSTSDSNTLVRQLVDATRPSEERMVAAGILSFTGALSPRERFYADVTLITSVTLKPWDELLSRPIEEVLTKHWRSVAYYQKFALRQPGLVAPKILQAVDDTSRTGRAKAANILLSAKSGIDLTLDPSTLETLKKLAGN